MKEGEKGGCWLLSAGQGQKWASRDEFFAVANANETRVPRLSWLVDLQRVVSVRSR